jgi:hypothetical protein
MHALGLFDRSLGGKILCIRPDKQKGSYAGANDKRTFSLTGKVVNPNLESGMQVMRLFTMGVS